MCLCYLSIWEKGILPGLEEKQRAEIQDRSGGDEWDWDLLETQVEEERHVREMEVLCLFCLWGWCLGVTGLVVIGLMILYFSE